jgi:exosome complex exonuclease DIS3/RRP44
MEVEGIFYFGDTNKNVDERSYVVCSKNTYYLEDLSKSNNALNGDTVTYNNDTNSVTKILKRCHTPISGYLRVSSITVYGVNKRNVPQKMFICNKPNYPNFIVATKRPLQSSDIYVQVIPHDWNSGNKYPIAYLDREIGSVAEYEVEIDYLKVKRCVKWSKWKIKYKDIDITPNRTDLTELTTFSVDPIGCKDIDDALHFRRLSKDLIEVGVHIADVSSYFTPDSEIEQRIIRRCQSVYLENEQINMLPDELATDKCSLIEGVPRRAFSVIFKIDISTKKPTVVKTEFMKSIIINKKAMSYEEAEQLLGGTQDTELISDVNAIYKLGNLLHHYSVNKSQLYDTHKMIEVFMLTTNVAVAQHLYNKVSDKALLRVCNSVKLEDLKEDKNVEINSAVNLSNILKLEAAEYTSGSDAGHHPLGEKFYTHFTSPIRRYFDIAVHRQLYSTLYKEEYTGLNKDYLSYLNSKCKSIKKAERESYILEIIYKIYYEHNSVLDTYGYVATISDNKVNLYVPIFKIGLESIVFSNEIKDQVDYFSDDNSLIFEKKEIKLFDKVDIQIVVTVKEPVFKKKIMVQITQPNFSLLHMEKID